MKVGTFSLGIRYKPNLRALLGASSLVYWPVACGRGDLSAVVGWGYRGKSRYAKKFAERHALPYFTLEDGWIRSLGISGRWGRTLSLVCDDLGVYYDATRPSRLEKLIAEAGFDEKTLAQARALRQRITGLRISKYNHAPPAPLLPSGEKVLVVDQTWGDLSIRFGMADATSFRRMLDSALQEHPAATIYLKVHPQVLAGRRRGHFDLQNLPARVQVISQDMNPLGLIEQMDHVHVVSSQLGFEALMQGKPVTCHGMPYYAGWGLTDDRLECERRGVERSLDEVFAAAYLRYARYFNPVTGHSCELGEFLDFFSMQLNGNQGRYFCLGFRYWKRYIVRAFLQGPGVETIFCRNLAEAEAMGLCAGEKLVVWASKEPEKLVDYCHERRITLLRIEDGFLRSVGLGSDFVTPVSLVVDNEGIYYDPSCSSQLERILQMTVFNEEKLKRAAGIRQRLVQSGITKYNLSASSDLRFEGEDGRLKILVPGQVEDDASVVRGGGDIQDNLALLRQVRVQNPDAFILFKPHPDVEAGNRKRLSSIADLRQACDAYVTDAGILQCLDWADEVHTLTSLTGFEALLRDIPVVTYGSPFYAGWGLTRDNIQQSRRSRKLLLDEMVAGVLLDYPRYYDWSSRNFMGPESAIDILLEKQSQRRSSAGLGLPMLRHGVIKARQLANMLRYF